MSHYIFYNRLEDLIDELDFIFGDHGDGYHTVYALPISTTRQRAEFISEETMKVVTAFMLGDQVHCCHILGGKTLLSGDTPLDSDHDERKACFDSLYDTIKVWLKLRKLRVREAMVAMPKDLVGVNGWANFLHYDKETNRFTFGGQPLCQEEGCDNEGQACYLPDDYEDEPSCWYCPEHMHAQGFCPGCHTFWGGVEAFDFSSVDLCPNCTDQIESELDDDYDEIQDTYMDFDVETHSS